MHVPTASRFPLRRQAADWWDLLRMAGELALLLRRLAAGDGNAELALMHVRSLQWSLDHAEDLLEPLCPPGSLGIRPAGYRRDGQARKA